MELAMLNILYLKYFFARQYFFLKEKLLKIKVIQ